MAFWGVVVKPGRSVTHPPLNARLHLSQATLGSGFTLERSIVRCTVGNKRSVFLCCLFPGKIENCQLNLEFEEANAVVFSVTGTRSVHLTGYYMHTPSPHHPNDDQSISIGETDSERSQDSEEDDSSDSFINDDSSEDK